MGMNRLSRQASTMLIQTKAEPARSAREALRSLQAERSTRCQETQTTMPIQGTRPRPATARGSHQRAVTGPCHCLTVANRPCI